MYCENNIWGWGGNIIGSLVSHLGILDDEFEEIIAVGKISKVWSWYKKMGMSVQTHRYCSITWIYFEEAFTPLQWEHLPIHQIIGENIRPEWVCRPTCGWLEISSGEKICLDVRYQFSEIIVKRLVQPSASEEMLKIMEDYTKISQSIIQWGSVEHNIGKRAFSLPKNCVPVTKLQLNSLK